MKLRDVNTRRWTTIGPETYPDDALGVAATRLVQKVYGRDHYAMRRRGWGGLCAGKEFTVHVCCVAGGLSEDVCEARMVIQD